MKIFILAILLCSACFGLQADFNRDGIVDFQDFAVMAGEWMETDMANNFLSFNDTVSQKVSVLTNTALVAGSGDFSICFWIQASSPFGDVLSKLNDGNGGWYITQFSTDLYFTAEAGGVELQLQAPLGDTDWHHVVFVIARSGGCIAYVDAVPIGDPVSSLLGAMNSTQPFVIGDISNGFTGGIDDVRLYKAAISQADVSEIHAEHNGLKYAILGSGKAASAAWDCDELNAFGRLVDAVGGLQGTLSGNLVLVEGGVPFITESDIAIISSSIFGGNMYGSEQSIYGETKGSIFGG